MAEILGMVEDLSLDTLVEGSRLRIKAGNKSDIYGYDFLVLEPGEKPLCWLLQTAPDGSQLGPGRAYLEGTGNWTTRNQNSAQTQLGEAMTISWGYMRIGGFVMIIDASNPSMDGFANRYQLMPECIEIEVLSSIVEASERVS